MSAVAKHCFANAKIIRNNDKVNSNALSNAIPILGKHRVTYFSYASTDSMFLCADLKLHLRRHAND